MSASATGIGRVLSERSLRIALGVVSVLGLGVAGYLTYARFSGGDLVCVVGGGCSTVQESEYSELLGIPVPLLGLMAYVGLLAAALIAGPLGRALGLFTAVVSFAFSAWLTYVEAAILEAWCAWCVASAILVTVATGLAIARVIVGNRADAAAAGPDSAAPSAIGGA